MQRVIRLIRHVGLPFMVIAALTLLTVSASSLILAVGYRNQLDDLRHVIYVRCQQQARFDEAQQETRSAQLGYYRHFLTNLAANPSGQRVAFDRQLVTDIHVVIVKLRKALDTGTPRGCSAFK